MNICIGEWFSLPFLGKGAFGKLRNFGVIYDSRRGFCFTSSTDIVNAASVISAEIGEKVLLTVKCFVCGKPTECHLCFYADICDRSRVSISCLCNEHFFDSNIDKRYMMTFESLAKSLERGSEENHNEPKGKNNREQRAR